MRILLVNTFHFRRGGDSTYTLALADLLRSKGHDVIFFAMKHPDNIPCDQEKYFVDYIDFVELNKKKNLSNAWQVLSRSIYSRQARRNISQLLDDLHPDIVHIQNMHGHITPSILYDIKDRGIPVFWTLHDYRLICPDTRLLSHGHVCEACKGGRFYQCVLRTCKKGSVGASFVASAEAYAHKHQRITDKVSRFISPSRFLAQKFVEFGWDGGRIVHIRNFLQEDRLCEIPQKREDYGLFLGQLEPWKGVSTLLKAARVSRDLAIKIVGDGSRRKDLEGMAKDLGLSKIEFAGHLKGKELEEALLRCSYVLVPSESYENCPYSVMEAMAAAKPVIASRIGGIPELVGDGENGMLFDPGNHLELAEKMTTLTKDVALCREMGVKGFEKARTEFSPDRHYEALMRTYVNEQQPGK